MDKAAPAKKQEAPSKHFCFTWNDKADKVTHEDVMKALEEHCEYIVFQEEKGEEGTKHYQGYAEFKKPLRFTAIHKFTPKGHTIWWAKRKGTRQQARDYAMKEDSRISGPWEGGTKPWSDKQGKQGKREDLDKMARQVQAGATDQELFEENPGLTVMFLSHLQKVRFIFKPTRTVDLTVALFYGPPGTGKTRTFWEMFPDGWSVPVGKDLWFTGYAGQRSILIDDFAGNIGLTQLLQILDRYPVQLPTKGFHCWFCPDVVVVTTNCHPCNWYDYKERQDSYGALTRRFHKVFHFKNIDEEAEETEVDNFFKYQKVVGRFTLDGACV